MKCLAIIFAVLVSFVVAEDLTTSATLIQTKENERKLQTETEGEPGSNEGGADGGLEEDDKIAEQPTEEPTEEPTETPTGEPTEDNKDADSATQVGASVLVLSSLACLALIN
eukprot:GHVL01007302.1.p1 GENE.GHVL01007302.1~~GHVL01007302.1.p1  ORF type:complete len:112 (-),score=23.59 GHVL01007302.1:756-1091(-)